MRKFLCILVLFALFFGFNAVCFAEVPSEAIQLISDDSMDILSTYKSGMSYQDWKQLYGKLVRDEAKFSAKYPNNEYSQNIAGLMTGYSIANQAWYYYMKGTNDAMAKDTIQKGMEIAKISHEELLKQLK